MKKIFIVPLLLLLAVILWNCEKDDICDGSTPTTPRLIISFYDATNPTVLKNVTNLAVYGEGVVDPVGLFNGVSKASIPLKTSADITNYSFVLNSTDNNNINQDNLQFTYARNDVFVSRACGYKTIFTLDPITPIVQTDSAVPDGLWIQNITVNQPNIQTENETHVNIYF